MTKTIVLFSAVLIGFALTGCAENTSSANENETPIFVPDNSSLSELSSNSQNPGNVTYSSYSTLSSESDSTGSSSNATFNSSSSITGLQSSSSVTPSSSGLKNYEDNHQPKESVLPSAGFYSSLTLNPPTPTKGGEIRCTFDGSFPTTSSEQIIVAKPIMQNTVVRCSEFVNGQPSDTTTQTYFINENVQMAVVALTVNHHDMFDSTDGLYATGPLTNNNSIFGGGFGDWGGFGGNVTDYSNPKCTEPCKAANFWSDKELPVHVEYFENGSASKFKNWEIDAGISIIGNYSRYKPKKSVAIKMDDELYHDKNLKYSLFKTRSEAKKFKSFNLRNNGNRFWTDYIGDAMMTSLMEGTSVDYQRSHQVVVFYNGEYFGIHDMRERLNRNFVETNYGIDSKSINMIKQSGSNLEASGNSGSTSEYELVLNTIASGNFQGENNAQYMQLQQSFNVGSFAEYMIAEIYMHNGDWPNNNVRVWGGSGYPFKFIIFDVDHGFGFTPGITGFDPQSTNMFQWISNNSFDQKSPGGIFKKLRENPDFKRMFINRAAILLNNYLTFEKVQSTTQAMMATIPFSEQSRDEHRFPRTESNFTWTPSGTDLISYAQNRSETVKQELASEFGLSGEISVTLTASGNGSIQIDGMTLPTKTYMGKFFAGNAQQLTAVPESGHNFVGWSDGSTDNPRLVQPNGGEAYTANFN